MAYRLDIYRFITDNYDIIMNRFKQKFEALNINKLPIIIEDSKRGMTNILIFRENYTGLVGLAVMDTQDRYLKTPSNNSITIEEKVSVSGVKSAYTGELRFDTTILKLSNMRDVVFDKHSTLTVSAEELGIKQPY